MSFQHEVVCLWAMSLIRRSRESFLPSASLSSLWESHSLPNPFSLPSLFNPRTTRRKSLFWRGGRKIGGTKNEHQNKGDNHRFKHFQIFFKVQSFDIRWLESPFKKVSQFYPRLISSFWPAGLLTHFYRPAFFQEGGKKESARSEISFGARKKILSLEKFLSVNKVGRGKFVGPKDVLIFVAFELVWQDNNRKSVLPVKNREVFQRKEKSYGLISSEASFFVKKFVKGKNV